MGSTASILEKAGIPTVLVMGERNEAREFAGIQQNGIPDAPHMLVNENLLYTADGGAKVADMAYQFIVDGLTKWQPQYLTLKDTKWVPKDETFTFTGATYEEALAKFNAAYLTDMRWGDGLPLVPPTKEKVDALVAASGYTADTVIGKWGGPDAEYTIQKIAINAAMAGARPEYMPVIVTAMQAITSVPWQNQTFVIKSPTPVIVVNGPVAQQIKINSGSNVFGPNPAYPANATIGRAIHFAMLNIPGNGRGLLPSNLAGGPGDYAGIVIAEAEDIEALISKGWDPLNVQLGFAKGSNTVTVLGVDQVDVSINGGFPNLVTYPAPDSNMWPATTEAFQKRTAGIVVVTEEVMALEGGLAPDPNVQAKGYASNLTKADIQKMMYEQARIPRAEFNKLFLTGADGKPIEPKGSMADLLKTLKDDEAVPIAASPNNFLVLASGGH